MRYIDTGRRQAKEALGAWLGDVVADPSVVELRIQSGFFDAGGLGHVTALLKRLSEVNGLVRILVGSNDGATPRSDIEKLVDLAGNPRSNLGIGVISFASGYFHPKVMHFSRNDGSMTAYVGSANLTRNGVASLHIEAGVILDANDGDDIAALEKIATDIDWWFDSVRDGMYPVGVDSDLQALVDSGVLDVALRPVKASASPPAAGSKSGMPRLRPLVSIPSVGETRGGTGAAAETLEGTGGEGVVTVAARWSKKLSASDAQRKGAGHQRGSITLVKGDFREINAQTYFRHELFNGAAWSAGQTRTGRITEETVLPMLTTIDGLNLGELEISISHEPGRVSGQNNYATLLHLGPLAPYFRQTDMTGKRIVIEARSDGSLALEIE